MASLWSPRWPRSHLKWALVGNQLFTQNDFEVGVHASSCRGLAHLGTVHTLVRPVSRVDSHVLVQAGRLREAFPTC